MSISAKNNLSMFNFTTLWFGAAISVAEILAGGLLAPLGFKMGLLAILLGHFVGTTLLVLGGVIGTTERIPALVSTRISFGQYGSYVFSVLNVLQLLGWTAVMIIIASDPDPSAMLLAANLSIVALGIIVLATVTTTFLDAYSAGVTFLNIFPKLNEKSVALVMTALGTGLAIIVNIEQYQDFLYAISSVFAPLFAILLTDYFLLKNKKIQAELLVNWGTLAICVIGTVLYYQFIKLNFILGATIPVMLIISVIHIITWRLTVKWKYVRKSLQT